MEEQPIDQFQRRRILEELTQIKSAIHDLKQQNAEVEKAIRTASADAAERDTGRFFRHFFLGLIVLSIIGWRWWTGHWPLLP
jgi:hypothetical protein